MHRRETFKWIALGPFAMSMRAALSPLAALVSEPHPVQRSFVQITDEQEIELGDQFAANAEKSLEIVSGGGLDTYLNGMVRRLARVSQRPNLPYSVKLVNSQDVNAFSIAGGHVYVHRGLIESIETEDELAATLGHEIGHIVARHSINELARELEARRLLSIVLANLSRPNGVVARVIDRLGGFATVLALLHYSRADENEADLLGFYEMLRAGWDPHGMLKLFQMLELVGPRASRYLSSHPPNADRAAVIRNELEQVRLPAGLRKDSIAFHLFKTTLGALPAPTSGLAR
jgi:predicted Zn-dependent protease